MILSHKNNMLTPKKINDFFEVHSGDYHAIQDLDKGITPLISCGELDNGLVGYFDIPEENTYSNAVTVAYNGRPLTAKYHPYKFGTKDDVAVLVPKSPMTQATLLYVAAQLNNLRWRYSYGRKCFKGKLENLKVPLPLKKQDGEEIIDQDYTAKLSPLSLSRIMPSRQKSTFVPPKEITWKAFKMDELFELERGDFHSIADLAPGQYPTVSRITSNNGIVGMFEKPDGTTVHPGGTITVSTVGGDAFVQLGDFIATDNILVCIPKIPLKPSVLFFIAFILNNQKWRYSYGRQPYKTKLQNSLVLLPVNENGVFDQEIAAKFVTSTSYWPQIERTLA